MTQLHSSITDLETFEEMQSMHRLSYKPKSQPETKDESSNKISDIRLRSKLVESVEEKRKIEESPAHASSVRALRTKVVTDFTSEVAPKLIISKSKTEVKAKKKTQTRSRLSSTMPGYISKQNKVDKEARESKNKGISPKTQAVRIRQNQLELYRKNPCVPESFLQFVEEIHQESRITPAEEIRLGTLCQNAQKLHEVYDNLVAKYNREPTDEEYMAASDNISMESLRNCLDVGLEAKNLLVTSNLRLIQKVVNMYVRNGMGSEYNAADMMEEGTLALIRAAEKFKPTRGFRFSTYAMYWIRSAIKSSFLTQTRLIKIPQRLIETNKKVLKVAEELEFLLGRQPTTAELSEAAEVTSSQMSRCAEANNLICGSLDESLVNSFKPGEKSKDTLHSTVGENAETEEMAIDHSYERGNLIATMRRYLTPHQVDLIMLRYGLVDAKVLPHGFSGPLTIAKISHLVGLKPHKVRSQIHNGLRQMKHLVTNEDGLGEFSL